MKAELVEQAALVITDPPILINLVSKRVRQLQAGRPALVERRPGLRDADIALTEIIQGKIKPGVTEEIEASEE
ncbi:MAG: DNA-directed RNA polymerase subunit omega [Verrucomicrobiaceae bacterium]|nr:DNA-directed RNA polymerase subunit omega [Verrucomicrobiaceae bacterium]